MTLALRFAARSHPGLLRTNNEDSVYAGPRLLAVADGMGGHAAGDVASAVTIAALAPLDEDAPGADLIEALRSAARSANTHLRDMAAGDDALAGMGTTLVALLFSGPRLGLLHIGDSRCYLLRDGELTQITHDHTLVQTLVDEGRISEADASTHPQRSVITRVLDGRDDMEPDLSVREAKEGDRYLVCSDGLTGPVGSLDTLREALLIDEPQDAVDRLVQLALRGGGPDNVTVIVADVIDDRSPATPPVIAGAAAEAPQEAPAGIADSAASRARVAEGRDTPPPARPRAPAPTNRRGLRTAIGVLLLAVVVVLGSSIGYVYVRSQYFVGLDDDNVAIFRGVHGSVAGISLNTVQDRTVLRSARLSDVERERLEDGIVAKDEQDAHDIVDRLFVTSGCPQPGASARPVATPTPTPKPAASPAPASTATPTPAVPCT
ncbi:MAG: serine/threonine protein phosphatase [Frankiales bacterium]|nr:serine/threonine protein phosphatase [Frankiales bacterium]